MVTSQSAHTDAANVASGRPVSDSPPPPHPPSDTAANLSASYVNILLEITGHQNDTTTTTSSSSIIIMNGSVPHDDAGGGGGMSASERERLVMTQYVLFGVAGNVLVVLGLLGNTLSIVVLCNRRMRSSTSYYLTSLAVYDNFILVAMLLFFNLAPLGVQNPVVLIPVAYPLSLTAQMGSIYTCVAFTVERFIAVCRPLHAANMCTKSRAKRAILLIFLWSLLYNIPRCFYYEFHQAWDNATGDYRTAIRVSEFGQNEMYHHVYMIILHLVFMFLVPFLVILVLNTALLRAINRSRQQRQRMSTSDTREHNLTVMLVAVIGVFLLCQFPTIVDNILVAVVGEEKHHVIYSYQILYTVCTHLVTINSSLNFVLYCLFGKKFRMVLCHILRLNPGRRQGCNACRSTIYQSRINGNKTSHCGTYEMEVSLV